MRLTANFLASRRGLGNQGVLVNSGDVWFGFSATLRRTCHDPMRPRPNWENGIRIDPI